MKLLIALLTVPSIALAEGYYYPVPANPQPLQYVLPPAYIVPPQQQYLPPPVYIQPIQPRAYVPYEMPSTGIAVPYGGTR